MGMLELSIKGQPRVRITPQMKASPCQQGDNSHCVETKGSQVELPEDIFHQIHSLMPMRDAAQVACVSRAFLHSWRCYSNLLLSVDSLGIKESGSSEDEITRDFIDRVDHIMHKHSGMGVKTLRLRTYPCLSLHPSYVDRWLQVAIAPGMKEFELSRFEHGDMKYNFPASFLSTEARSSIQSFLLSECSFNSAAQVGCMHSLTKLDLQSIHITGEELYGFLLNSCALEQFYLSNCDDIICLKIPCLLQKLDILYVVGCKRLEMIDSNAPNLSTFSFAGRPIHISLGDALQVRKVSLSRDYSSDALYYASTKPPFIAPNLQALELSTSAEMVDTPMVFGKFFHLKYLEIAVSGPNFSPDYDFFSLISFLDASPALETFILRILWPTIRHDSIVEDPADYSSHVRCLSELHNNLKNVMITGFCSAKSMIKLTTHIIEKTKSLECLTLDTTRGHDMRFSKVDRCLRLSKEALVEAEKARVAIRRYVEGRMPPAVNLKVIEPCSKCVVFPSYVMHNFPVLSSVV